MKIDKEYRLARKRLDQARFGSKEWVKEVKVIAEMFRQNSFKWVVSVDYYASRYKYSDKQRCFITETFNSEKEARKYAEVMCKLEHKNLDCFRCSVKQETKYEK